MCGISSGDKCPSCGAPQMPPYDPSSLATGRACQACGFVEDLPPTPLLPDPPTAQETHEQRYVGGMHADH